MSIQMKPGEKLSDFMDRRRAELMGGANIDSPFANVESGSSSQPTTSTSEPKDERGVFERFAHKTYVNRREQQESDAELFERDPAAYFDQYGADATRLNEILGGPATKGMNVIKGVGTLIRRGAIPRKAGEAVAKKTGIVAARTTPQGISKGSLADELAQLGDEATDLATVAQGKVKTFGDAQALGSNVMSKASLAMKTPDDFARILRTVPAELVDDFYRGMGTKLVQAVRDMPRLTKDAQRNMLSPSGRNILKHTLQGMDDAEFDKLMVMLERGLWTEVRNKILKWGVGLPLLGYIGLRQFLPK